MKFPLSRDPLLLAQRFTQTCLARLRRLAQFEALSGVLLLLASALALIWANSSFADSYHALWQIPISFAVGGVQFSRSLHFFINDGLMTLFFLVVGMEIRREIHAGALSSLRQAALPIVAACGGVAVPALLYARLNVGSIGLHGWAIPTATDIAFAVGLLALLGKRVPVSLRIFLLTLAVIDDVIAVLLIALFYSSGLYYPGFALAGAGILLVLVWQRMGIASAFAYLLPGALIWIGMLMTGAHPTLAGVMLGLLTPVTGLASGEAPRRVLARLVATLRWDHAAEKQCPPSRREVRLAQRALLAPVIRVQQALHPWVSFVLMPLFAVANAGISLAAIDLSISESRWAFLGVTLALLAGKPVGVFISTWVMVRLGLCRLPAGLCWRGVALIGLLAGIGFTMSIFIANLAFQDANLLGAAKLGVLLGSSLSAVLGLGFGLYYLLRLPDTAKSATASQ
jgi:NhaA family Na+:H+ antiporter